MTEVLTIEEKKCLQKLSEVKHSEFELVSLSQSSSPSTVGLRQRVLISVTWYSLCHGESHYRPHIQKT